MSARSTFGTWYRDSRQGVLAPVVDSVGSKADSKVERLGDAVGTALTGVAIGALTGTGSALAPDGLSAGALGTAAIVALGGAALRSGKAGSRVLSNAGAALSALAMHEYMGNKVTQKAGTTTQVLTNKAKAIAAHGDAAGELNAGADPLVEYGARRFASAT